MKKEFLNIIIEQYKDNEFFGCFVEGKRGHGMSAFHHKYLQKLYKNLEEG